MGKIKNKSKNAGKYVVKRKKSKEEIEKSKEEEIEKKFYWTRAISGALAGLFGRLVFGLIGWSLFIWLISWWFGWPWIMSFVIFRIPYDKEKWSWKNILKTGIGIFFFTFMVVSTIIHTFIVMPEFEHYFSLFNP